MPRTPIGMVERIAAWSGGQGAGVRVNGQAREILPGVDDDEVRFASAANVAAICSLIYEHWPLLPVLAEHLVDNEGEVLSHPLLSDVVRWLVENRNADATTCRSVFGWLERAAELGPDQVTGMIALSGVGMLPNPGEPGAELRDLLGPTLRAFDPWRDTPGASRG